MDAHSERMAFPMEGISRTDLPTSVETSLMRLAPGSVKCQGRAAGQVMVRPGLDRPQEQSRTSALCHATGRYETW